MIVFEQDVPEHFVRGNSLAGLSLALFFISNRAQRADGLIVLALGVGKPGLRDGQVIGDALVLSLVFFTFRFEVLLDSFQLPNCSAGCLKIPASGRANSFRQVSHRVGPLGRARYRGKLPCCRPVVQFERICGRKR